MDRISEFVKNKCIIEDDQKVPSGKLYSKFIEYLKEIGDNRADKLSNKLFTQTMKKEYQQFPIKKHSQNNCFIGLTLAEYYVNTFTNKKSLSPMEYKLWKKNYNQSYYLQNKDEISKKSKTKREIKYDQEMELIKRLNISKEQFFNRKHYGLIRYKFNNDYSINWEETLSVCQHLADEFKIKQQRSRKERRDNKIKQLSNEYVCYKYNREHIETIDEESSIGWKDLEQKKEIKIKKLQNTKILSSNFGNSDVKFELNEEPLIDLNNITKNDYNKYIEWFGGYTTNQNIIV